MSRIYQTRITWEPDLGVFSLVLAIAALLSGVAFSAKNARGQEFDQIQAIVNPRLVIERNRAIGDSIRDVVGNRLVTGKRAALQTGADVQSAGTQIVPTATDNIARAGISAWVDGSYTNIKDSSATRAFNSDQFVISSGLDRQLTDRFLVGLIFSYADSDTKNVFVPGSSASDGYHVGGYFGLTLSDNIVFDTSFLYNWTDNNVRDNTGIFASYDSRGWTVSSNLTGYWFFDQIRFSPTLGFSWSSNRDEAYVDSAATAYAGERSRTGTLSFGATIARTIRLDGKRTLEPFLTVIGDWEFSNSVSPPVAAGTAVDRRRVDFRIETGIELSLSQNVSLSLNGSFGGLARKRYRTLSGGGRLTISF